MKSPCCLCIPYINYWMAEPIFIKFDMYIIEFELISTTYFKNLSYQSLRLYVSPIIVKQQVGKNVTVSTVKHATVE